MPTRNRGFFRNALDTIVEARQRQANQYVAGALDMLDDATLKAYGHSRESIKRMRSGSIY